MSNHLFFMEIVELLCESFRYQFDNNFLDLFQDQRGNGNDGGASWGEAGATTEAEMEEAHSNPQHEETHQQAISRQRVGVMALVTTMNKEALARGRQESSSSTTRPSSLLSAAAAAAVVVEADPGVCCTTTGSAGFTT